MPRDGYIGRAPGDSAVVIARETFEPTGVQTNFTFSSGYTVGYLDVYLNGARLIFASDYTASDGSTVGLTTYADNGDVIECVAYKAFNVGNVTDAAGNFSVANKLTVVGMTSVGDVVSSGIVTADAFYGDGSTLSGLTTSSVPGINTERHSVFNTIKASGIITATDGSFTNVTIGGTLTYDDVTNVDSLGIVTARKGVMITGGEGLQVNSGGIQVTAGVTTARAGLRVSGISSFANDVGIGTTRPDSIARVNNTTILNAGIVTAYQYYGDVSNCSGAGSPGIVTTGTSTFVNINASGIGTFADLQGNFILDTYLFNGN